MTSTTKTSDGIQSTMDQLIAAFAEEHKMLGQLEERLSDKLEAIRTRSASRLEETTHDISQTNQQLDTLAERRSRHIHHVARALGTDRDVRSIDGLMVVCRSTDQSDLEETLGNWQEKMREQAMRTQERCEEVTFALQYATRLGQEMLHALRGRSPRPSNNVTEGYTSTGTAASHTQSPSLVNHIG